MNRKTLVVVVLLGSISAAFAQKRQKNYDYNDYGTGSNPRTTQVEGYSRKDGTYVQPHTRTERNDNTNDNYGSYGNYNPNTGKTDRSRKTYDSNPYDNR